jgi:hypothetical protein
MSDYIKLTIDNIKSVCKDGPVTLSKRHYDTDSFFRSAIAEIEANGHGLQVVRTPTRIHISEEKVVV